VLPAFLIRAAVAALLAGLVHPAAVFARMQTAQTPAPAEAPAPPRDQPAGVVAPANPDELYRGRQHRPNAEAAAEIWAVTVETNFESAWKLARACYWLGTHGTEEQRRTALERGVQAGETGAKLGPDRPEGHFWMAANMGMMAEAFGLSQGLKYRGRIKQALERVLAMQPGWQMGSAEAALGRWYARVPRLMGGNKGKAEGYYKEALAVDPHNRLALIYYAELLEDDKPMEARALLQRVLEAPLIEEWGPEDADWVYKAKERLARIKPR
jgi:hypothetical protein